MQVIKNFLSLKEYQEMKKIILANNFPWYYNNSSITKKSHPQFTHLLYSEQGQVISPFIKAINPFIEKIKPFIVFDIKINLNYRSGKIVETGMHYDLEDKRFKSAIFFFNKCNGYCRVEDEKVYSEDNKVLIIDSNTLHTGSTCTDTHRRVVLNIIYLPL